MSLEDTNKMDLCAEEKEKGFGKLVKLEEASKHTILVMTFPPQTPLPSVSEIKSIFARFGDIDESLTEVFWESPTCFIVFKSCSNDQAAYDLAVSGTLFADPLKAYLVLPRRTPVSDTSGSGDSTDQLMEGSSIEPKSCLEDAMGIGTPSVDNQGNGDVNAPTNGVDISERMLFLMREISKLVAATRGSSGNVS